MESGIPGDLFRFAGGIQRIGRIYGRDARSVSPWNSHEVPGLPAGHLPYVRPRTFNFSQKFAISSPLHFPEVPDTPPLNLWHLHDITNGIACQGLTVVLRA